MPLANLAPITAGGMETIRIQSGATAWPRARASCAWRGATKSLLQPPPANTVRKRGGWCFRKTSQPRALALKPLGLARFTSRKVMHPCITHRIRKSVSLGPKLIATEGVMKMRELFGQPRETLSQRRVMQIPQKLPWGWVPSDAPRRPNNSGRSLLITSAL